MNILRVVATFTGTTCTVELLRADGVVKMFCDPELPSVGKSTRYRHDFLYHIAPVSYTHLTLPTIYSV